MFTPELTRQELVQIVLGLYDVRDRLDKRLAEKFDTVAHHERAIVAPLLSRLDAMLTAEPR